MTDAVSNMRQVYDFVRLAGQPSSSVMGAGTLDSLVFTPGIYRWSGALNLATKVTLNGTCGQIFIFQVGFVYFSSLYRSILILIKQGN